MKLSEIELSSEINHKLLNYYYFLIQWHVNEGIEPIVVPPSYFTEDKGFDQRTIKDILHLPPGGTFTFGLNDVKVTHIPRLN